MWHHINDTSDRKRWLKTNRHMWETHLKAILMGCYLYFLFLFCFTRLWFLFFVFCFFFSQKHLTLGIPLIIISSLNPIPEPMDSRVWDSGHFCKANQGYQPLSNSHFWNWTGPWHQGSHHYWGTLLSQAKLFDSFFPIITDMSQQSTVTTKSPQAF